MRALVTGAAGFIGSHLVDALVGRGDDVTGLDALTPYYDPSTKRANLAAAATNRGFDFVAADLTTLPAPELTDLADGVDVIFHLAAQPGVRTSWDRFDDYLGHNVLATHRLLEAVRRTRGADRPAIVYASSSSVYGDAAAYPTTEDHPLRPHSPYGVTKLAGEQLCGAYAANHGIAARTLRYFTVYGPRQRPDMAIHRLCEAALGGSPFPLYGAGDQIRDVTHAADVVAATLALADADGARSSNGVAINVAGGSATSVLRLIDLLGELAGTRVPVEPREVQPGDVARTGGSTARATALFGWRPRVRLVDGLADQLAWHRQRLAV